MKITQNLLLIFLFLFITNDLFAGLGTTTWGPGGIKRDVEVNEIEEIESEEKQKDTSDSNDEFKAIELNNIDSNTIGTITEDEGGLSYNMWAGSEINIIKDYLKNEPINKESNLAIDLIKNLLLSTAAVEGSKGDTDLIFSSISTGDPFRVYNAIKNRVYFERKHLVRNNFIYAINILMFLIILFPFTLKNIVQYLTIIKGIRHGFKIGY